MQNRNSGLGSNPYINTAVTQEVQSTEPVVADATQNVNPYYNAPQAQQPVEPTTLQSVAGSFDTGNFLKGALIGAIGAYLLTNEDAQKKIFKTIAKGTDFLGAGIEEIKERFEDAKAELEAEREEK